MSGEPRKPVIASQDNFIIDGHHRWLVALNTGGDLNIFRVNIPAYELYNLVNKYNFSEQLDYSTSWNSLQEQQ